MATSDYEIRFRETLEHDTTNGEYNSVISIDGTHFIVFYQDLDTGGGELTTFSTDEDGKTITELNSIAVHSAANAGLYGSMILIDTDKVMIAYTGYSDDGYVKTYSWNTSYVLAQIDSLEHAPAETVTYNSLALIDSTHAILAWVDSADDGHLTTFSFDSAGDNIAEIDDIEFETSNIVRYVTVVKADNYYIVAYESVSIDGVMKSFSINGSYEISTVIDTLNFDTSNYKYADMCAIENAKMVFVVGYMGAGDAIAKTFYFDTSGDNLTQQDSHTLNANVTYDSAVIQVGEYGFMCVTTIGTNTLVYYTLVTDTNYDNIEQIDVGGGEMTTRPEDSLAVTFSPDSQIATIAYPYYSSYDANVTTLFINVPFDGDYAMDVIDTDTFDTFGAWTQVVTIDATHCLVAFKATGNDCTVKTFSHDGDYDNITLIDTEIFDSVRGDSISICRLDTDLFVIAWYGSASAYSKIATFSIDGSYIITIEDDDTHETVACYFTSLIKLDTRHCALAYRGADYDGFIKTFTIASDYSISETDELEHDNTGGSLHTLCYLADGYFGLAYIDTSGYANYKTFSYDVNYDITEIDEYRLSSGSTCQTFHNLLWDSTHVAVDYYDSATTNCKLDFLTFDGNYDNISLTKSNIITTTEAPIVNSMWKMDKVDDEHIIIGILLIEGGYYPAALIIYNIDSGYEIGNFQYLKLQTASSVSGSYVSVMMGTDPNYVYTAFQDLTNTDGILKTIYIDIESGITSNWFFFI